MRVKEMHPLCCISLESPGIGDLSPEVAGSKGGAGVPAAEVSGGSDGNGGRAAGSEASFAGVLYKWTNYGKGWRSRWFLLRNGVVSYSKALSPAGDDVRLIGDVSSGRLSRKNHRSFGIVHLKQVSSFRESKSDDRRFYIFTATKTLHLRTNSRRDRVAWIEALVSSRNLFYLRPLHQSLSLVPNDVSISTERLKKRLTEGGIGEELVKDCEQIMLSEFLEIQGQFKVLCQERSNLLDTLRQLEAANIEAEGSGIHDSEYQLIKHEVSSIGRGKYSECSTTTSSDDIEKQELEEVSDEDDALYFDTGNSLLRILNVAAFAVSGYGSSEGRHCKPFNPLLGETFEADYPDKGIRFFSEKVSHHPTLIACHCEGKGWKFWGDSNLRTKFWGTSIQLDPVGTLTLEFDDGEVFQWNKVTTTICNLILGKVYLDHHGTMHIRGNRQYSCKLKFKEQSFLDRNPHQVHGFVEDVTGKKAATLFGKWDESMHYVNGDGTSKPKDFSDSPLLWKRCKAPNYSRYNMTSFAITLNELTPGLQEKLPPTDSRLRPDQRHLENGEYEKANGEKLRLEKRQRMSRKLQDNGWKPMWFQKEGADGPFRYMGGYWEARQQAKWDGCPNIFGEISEDLQGS